MKTGVKIAIVALLAVAVAATIALRGSKRAEYVATPIQSAVSVPVTQGSTTQTSVAAPERGVPLAAATAVVPAAVPAPRAVAPLVKPRILELGSMRCQSCLEMAKVLDALRKSQGSKLQVDFIDVFEQPEAAGKYAISLIPTQILFDAAGKEVFRHTGFFSHDDILAKFRNLGVKI